MKRFLTVLVFSSAIFAQLDSVYTKNDLFIGTIVWARPYSLVMYSESSEKKAVRISDIKRLILNSGEVIIGDHVSSKKYLAYLETLDAMADAHMDSLQSIIRQIRPAVSTSNQTDQTVIEHKPSLPYVQDVDGNSYKTVRIGNQVWMAENLKVTHYRDGTPIPSLKKGDDWAHTDSGAMCIYNNNGSNEARIYGNLYNWYAVIDTRGIAPPGWHVPSDSEWIALEAALSTNPAEDPFTGHNRGEDVGGALAGEAALWDPGVLEKSPRFGESEFSALPSGYRGYLIGQFGGLGYSNRFWSSTEANQKSAWHRSLSSGYSGIYRDIASKQTGYAIRCVKGPAEDTASNEVAEKYDIFTPLDRRLPADKLVSGETWVGMDSEQAKASLGEPQRINRTEISYVIYERWVYPNGLLLFFEDGRLKGWEK